MMMPSAGIVPGAGIPGGSSEEAVQQAREDPHQVPPRPRRQLGAIEPDAEWDTVWPIP